MFLTVHHFAAKISGKFGGGGGFSLFDFDNLPEFEPLQAVLTFLKGEEWAAGSSHLNYGNYADTDSGNQEEEQQSLTPTSPQIVENKLKGLDKLLSVRM